MSALSDLTDAVNANTTAVNAAVPVIEAGGGGGTPDADLAPLTAQLQANNLALNTALGITGPGTGPTPGPGVAFKAGNASARSNNGR